MKRVWEHGGERRGRCLERETIEGLRNNSELSTRLQR